MKEVKDAVDKSIWHWISDIYIHLLMERKFKKGKMYEDPSYSWEDRNEPFLTGSCDCPLCNEFDGECDEGCPLKEINDKCVFNEQSSYSMFMKNPSKETAYKMIQSLIKAKEYVENSGGI
jgi:hypothetical protein